MWFKSYEQILLAGNGLTHIVTKVQTQGSCIIYSIERRHYGFKLNTKYPSEINNKFEKTYLKSIINHFTIFQLRVRYFVIKTMLVLNILPILGLTLF